MSYFIQAAMTKYTDWVAYTQYTFIAYSSGGWKSKIKDPAWSEGLFPRCRLLIVSSPEEKSEGSLSNLLHKTLIPFMKSLLSWPKDLQKAPSPNTITFEHQDIDGREEIHVYLWLIQQKLTQHSMATILQQKAVFSKKAFWFLSSLLIVWHQIGSSVSAHI